MNARFFSTYPPHTKIEMPNLSPTMEKVNIIYSYLTREILLNGINKLEIK
jgi:hypothetical protein